MNNKQLIDLLVLLSERLERLSADSRWSHRASGIRGSIQKLLLESEHDEVSCEQMELLIHPAFDLLNAAAQEIPDKDVIIYGLQRHSKD